MALALAHRAQTCNGAAGRVDAYIAAVEQTNAEYVAHLGWSGTDNLGKRAHTNAHQLAFGAFFCLLLAQAFVIHRLQHFIQRGLVIATVNCPSKASVVGKLICLDEVAPANFRLVDTELLRQHVDHAFDQVYRFCHPQRTTISDTARRLVGIHRIDATICCRDVVRTGANAKQSGRQFGRRYVRVECTMVGQCAKAQRLDAAILVRRQFADTVVIARETGGGNIIDA